MYPVKLILQKNFFGSKEKVILESGSLSASTFIFESGVKGLRLRNQKGEMIILPYQGQQIWRASFCGKELSMKSSFQEPLPTTDYLSTYGGFVLHCGMTGMGVPGAKDNHPLHGELPNMPYEKAYVQIGGDERGNYIEVGGEAQFRVAFTVNYMVYPKIRLYENETTAEISLTVENLRQQLMEYMYLCHINFRPIEGARLIYNAPYDTEHIKIHKNIPSGMPEDKAIALRAYMDELSVNPALQNVVDSSSQIYDPEIVFTVKYNADNDGYAHCMQLSPEGDAFYVAFRPEELPYGLRWISRTGDEDAMGMVLPATAEHKGYTYAKENGDIRTIAAGQSITVHIKVGYLDKEHASEINSHLQ